MVKWTTPILFPLMLLCVLMLPTAHADKVYSIRLKHKTVEQIIPALKSVMPDQHFGGQGQVLLIRVDDQINGIREAIAKLDKPKEQLMIRLRYAKLGNSYQHRPLLRDIKTYQTTSNRDYKNIQEVAVADGETARVSNTYEFPILSVLGAGFYPVAAWDYKDVTTGVDIIPIIKGNQVEVTIRSQRQNLNRFGLNKIDSQGLSTTVTVPFGKWVRLGSQLGKPESDKVKNVYETGDRVLETANFYIKVDKLYD